MPDNPSDSAGCYYTLLVISVMSFCTRLHQQTRHRHRFFQLWTIDATTAGLGSIFQNATEDDEEGHLGSADFTFRGFLLLLISSLIYTQSCLLAPATDEHKSILPLFFTPPNRTRGLSFLKRSSPPNSNHGAFSSHGFSLLPCTWTTLQLFEKLPPEIQNMLFEYDIGRLLFVMRTASQIATQYEGLKTIPEQRLSQRILIVKSDIIRIHPINIGGRIYISCLSDTTGLRHGRTKSRDYKLNASGYLAVKSDGIGVIDIAFRATDTGPEWILDNQTGWRIQPEISIIRCADVHQLRIICDTLKCRAIVPLNRTGAEPYFQSRSSPPQDSWVDSSFAVESEFTVHHDPFAYFTRATYIPFGTMKKITFDVDPGRLGINQITANNSESPKRKTSIHFPEPPTKLKFFLCGVPVGNLHTFQYPFLQFMIDGQWQPSLPHDCIVLRQPVLVEGILGIWWGETFPSVPIHIGIVVSNKAALKNTVL